VYFAGATSSWREAIMRACNLTIFAFALALAVGDSAHAHVFSVDPVGGTCVPDSATVRAGQYETAGFGVRFGNGVGKIRLFCALHVLLDEYSFVGMLMGVIDADGMEAGGRIRAHFRGAVIGSNTWFAIGTCDSNTSNITTPHQIVCHFDPHRPNIFEWYWWDVEIERTTPNVNVEFLGIKIQYGDP
jgi:hypothetical protein